LSDHEKEGETPLFNHKNESSNSYKKQKPNGTYSYLNSLINTDLPLIDVIIAVQGNRNLTKAKCLLDSGADVSYISLDMVKALDANKYLISCINCFTCTGTGDTCHSIVGLINLTISYVNELSQRLTLKLSAHVIKELKYDLIIGRSTIKQHNLILQFPRHFLDLDALPRYWDLQAGRGCGRTVAAKLGTRTDDSGNTDIISVSEENANPLCGACSSLVIDASSSDCKTHSESAYPSCEVVSSRVNDASSSDRKTHVGESESFDKEQLTSVNCNHNSFFRLNSLNRSNRSDYEKEDIHEIRDDQMEAIPSEMLGLDVTKDSELPTDIHGPPSLQAKLRKLITEYQDIFSRKVRATPARLPPFNFTVDEEKWKVHRNRTSPRRYDSTKSAALQKIVEQLLELGVIEPSDAAYYSHGFPVPKSTAGAWRLVIDLKNLNKISSTESWPIPNIKELLNRLGTHQASYFAVMDLTMGYHQAPIDPSCKKYTAFRTDTGLYQWNRLAMGLQGAGSYFQRVMSTIVLPRLIHSICELYLDDCIVPGQDEDSFISRLEQVFTRFREFGITLHPDKCRFGLSEVEYVGVKISKEGTHFTRSKLDSILDFKEPSTQGELKSFLGFANWFRDHVREYHSMSGPLHAMLSKYNRRTRLRWSEFTRNCYENLKVAIHECPQLYFLDEDSPIFLHTDASDYGVGAYLFQVVDGTQRPIAFLSKSLNERMRRWDTPQKEGFAIFYALDKFDYLLRDRKFTVRTDHANLTRLREDYSANKKVQRWLTCFQHYDITFDYIKGSLNIVADTLSRHCLNNFSLRDFKTNLNTQTLAIPAKYVSWLTEAHNSVVGHHGVENTLAKLSVDRPDWPGRAKHVRMFIANCPTCQKMDQRRANVQAHPTTASSYRPNQRIAVDYIERLTPDQNGNTSILVIIDCFTRYVELYPVKTINAITSAECLLDWFTRYGAPNEISHDNGTSFVNQTLAELKKLVGSNSKIATAYSKEENPIVERANKEVMRHLRNIIFDNNVITTWSIHVPLVRRIMNSSIHAATGFTPASLMFGNSIDIDKGFLFPNKHEDNPQVPYTFWSAQRLSAHATLLDVARQNLTEKDEVHMMTYPTGRSDFDINSYVLVEHRQNNLRRGPHSKLLPFLKGPLRVMAKVDNTYTLQDIVTMRSYDYHIKNLRVFNFDPNSQNPLTYALKDDGTMYQVEYISKHRGDPKKGKNQLQFLVHWVGYDEVTWEPWSHVRRNIKLHEYLRTHKSKAIRDLLPDNFDIDTHTFSDEE
jgi:transposase InsO family protein